MRYVGIHDLIPTGISSRPHWAYQPQTGSFFDSNGTETKVPELIAKEGDWIGVRVHQMDDNYCAIAFCINNGPFVEAFRICSEIDKLRPAVTQQITDDHIIADFGWDGCRKL
jgi:hypothetical protein